MAQRPADDAVSRSENTRESQFLPAGCPLVWAGWSGRATVLAVRPDLVPGARRNGGPSGRNRAQPGRVAPRRVRTPELPHVPGPGKADRTDVCEKEGR